MIPEHKAENYIHQLADEIAKEVDNLAVIAAFRAVPRHRFLMQGFHLHDRQTHQMNHHTLENTELHEWLKIAYSNRALMIALGESPSSSSEPILMAQMLNALDIKEGMRVLEIGTGTGYNAALLTHLVGETGAVFSVDRQAHLCEAAGLVLKEVVGDKVKIRAGNGLLGFPEFAPYERIIATASHTRIPPAWIEQLAIGGKLLGNIGVGGGLLLVEKTEAGIESHYIEQVGYFMSMIDENVAPIERQVEAMNLSELDGWDFRFFLEWLYPDIYCSSVSKAENSEEEFVQFHANRKSAQLDSNGKLKLINGEESYLDEISAILERWKHFGMPKRGDFHVKLEADERQMLYIKSEPIRELK